jgi:8-amino-3,8-dideoxy-alpha-D-manno-octulosonate transaminase
MPGYEIIGQKEKKAVSNLFDEGGVLFAHGFDNLRKRYYVREFEHNCSKYFKAKYALFVSSGTAALKIALKALGVKRGDEVITQAFNFIATIEAIIDIGAIPKIVNVDMSLNMDPYDLKKKISKKTKVVIPVHMLGFSSDLLNIQKICKKKNVSILEDNCESVGGKYFKKYLGTIGKAGVFSFDHGKIITTGEGGLILTNNKKIINYCKQYHDHGHKNIFKDRGNDICGMNGFNYRATEMQAIIGQIQLKKLKYIIRENKKRFIKLKNILKKKYLVRSFPKNTRPNYDTFIFFEEKRKKRNQIINILKKYNIGTKNLPDAIKWHCTYYWKYALSKKEIFHSIKTKKILEKSIAIPIKLKINIKNYQLAALEINNLV